MPSCCKYTYDNGQCSSCGLQTKRGLTLDTSSKETPEIYRAGDPECDTCTIKGIDPGCYCIVRDVTFVDDEEIVADINRFLLEE